MDTFRSFVHKMCILVLLSWLLAGVRCDVTHASDKLHAIFQEIDANGLHSSKIEVTRAIIIQIHLSIHFVHEVAVTSYVRV